MSIAVAFLATLTLAHGGDIDDPPRAVGQGELPYHVSMQVSTPGFMDQHICSGAIISKEWILTAAHCIKAVPGNASAFVLAGKVMLGHNEDFVQRCAVKNMYIHGHYPNGLQRSDIGLLHLKDKLVFSSYVGKILLPDECKIPGKAFTSGWGSMSMTMRVVSSEKLLVKQVPIMDIDTCYDFMNGRGRDPHPLNWGTERSNICVGFLPNKGFNSYNADGGSPLTMMTRKGENFVIGVASWNFLPCKQVVGPSVYTNVFFFLPWIIQTMMDPGTGGSETNYKDLCIWDYY